MTLVMYYCIMLCDSTNTDECEGDNECTQLCINTNGGYNCAYRDGSIFSVIIKLVKIAKNLIKDESGIYNCL